jgi:holo-ACP synthase/triphosphoribosyl-dephospho-CoA synthase
MILASKDEKAAFLASIDSPLTMFTLKVNQPFYPKNTHESVFLLTLFDHLIETVIKPKSRIKKEALCGDYIVYFTSLDPLTLKKMAIFLEDTHPLGRLVDIDVYQEKTILSRKIPRTCYLCNETAHYCTRNQTHKPYEIKAFITSKIQSYITKALAEETALALRKEVFLAPKFGLVSSLDSGAHEDMTIEHFLKSIEALNPYFERFAQAGMLQDYQTLRLVGIEAEKAMFKATNEINTHKGAIFIMGAILPFLASAIYLGENKSTMIHTMQTVISNLIKDDFKHLKEKEALTAGEIIYERYGIKGIRGEVLEGFNSIFSWYPNLTFNHYQKLCSIMAHLEDTTIIKRFNLQTLKDVQHDMRDLLKETPFNMAYYNALSERYKLKGISPGGSADLLSLVFLFDATLYLLDDN